MTEASCIVHVIDDDVSWRRSVARLLSATGYRVALHASAEAFLDTVNVDEPGCILLDLRMPGLSGLQLQQRLAEIRQHWPIVFLSGHGDVPSSVMAMRAGAEDFLTKPVPTEVLMGAVARAIERDREYRARHGQLDVLRSRVSTLTPTERKVFDLVVRGKLNKQTGDELGITERTIKWHRHNLMQKLQVKSLADLVLVAERLGLIGSTDRRDPESK